MDQPIRRGTDWWLRDHLGRWNRWDPGGQEWKQAAAGPPPPPPPPPPSVYTPIPGRLASRDRSMVFVAAALVIVLGIVGSWRWSELRGIESEQPASARPVAVTATESTVYDDFESNMARCGPRTVAESGQTPRNLRRLPKEIRDIAAIVSASRGLDFERQPAFSFMSEEELRAEMFRRANRDMKRVRDLLAPLYQLRLIDKKVTPRSIVRNASDQVAAFYVPKEGKIFAPRKGAALTAYEKVLLAHELDHALVDQTIGLFESKGFRPAKADRDSARGALVEGDATLLMTGFLIGGLSLQERQEFFEKFRSASADGSKLPSFIQRSMMFPYDEGLMFACRVFNGGGWPEVDAAYKHPPRSTAEILFPDRFRGRGDYPVPVNPTDPRTPAGWTRGSKVAFGAADLMFMIHEPPASPAERAQQARSVAGWNGGELQSWRRGRQRAVAVTIADSPATGMSVCYGLEAWFARTFSEGRPIENDRRYRRIDDGAAFFACTDDEARVVVAPDPKTAGRLIGRANMPAGLWKALASRPKPGS